MPFRIEIKSSARRELAALPHPIRTRIDAAILAMAEEPRPRGAVKLAGGEDLWRIRVGSYRVVYTILDDVLLVVVVRVRHRREAYR